MNSIHSQLFILLLCLSIAPLSVYAEEPGTQQHDYVAQQTLTRRMNTSKFLTAFPIQHRVSQGVVMLHGHVPSRLHRTLATALAASIPGVQSVKNRLTMGNQATHYPKSSIAKRSQMLAMALQIKLYQHKTLRNRPIFIDVNQETLLLSGKVHSLQEQQEAEFLALSVPQVKNVVNILGVK